MDDGPRPVGRLRGLTGVLRHPISQNALALYAVQAVLTVLPLITLPWLARVLGPAELGVVVFVQSFSFMLAIVIEYGFGLSATRRIAQQRGDEEAQGHTVAAVLGAKLTLIAAAAAGALVALFAVPAFREDPRLVAFGLAMATLQGLSPVWYFAGQERLRLTAAIDVTVRLLTTAAIVLLVREAGQGLRVLAIWTAGNGISLILLSALMYRGVRFRRPTSESRRTAIREGWALFVATAAVTFWTSGAVFMLGLVVSSAQLALFATAERIARAAMRATGPLAGAAYPRVSYLLSADQPQRGQRLAGLVLLALTALGSVTAVVLIVFARPLTELLFGQEFAESARLLRILAVMIPLVAITSTLSGLWMVVRGMDWASTRVALAAAAVSLALTPLVGSLAGPEGVAWLLVGIESAIAVYVVVFLRRRGLLPKLRRLAAR